MELLLLFVGWIIGWVVGRRLMGHL